MNGWVLAYSLGGVLTLALNLYASQRAIQDGVVKLDDDYRWEVAYGLFRGAIGGALFWPIAAPLEVWWFFERVRREGGLPTLDMRIRRLKTPNDQEFREEFEQTYGALVDFLNAGTDDKPACPGSSSIVLAHVLVAVAWQHVRTEHERQKVHVGAARRYLISIARAAFKDDDDKETT